MIGDPFAEELPYVTAVDALRRSRRVSLTKFNDERDVRGKDDGPGWLGWWRFALDAGAARADQSLRQILRIRAVRDS